MSRRFHLFWGKRSSRSHGSESLVRWRYAKPSIDGGFIYATGGGVDRFKIRIIEVWGEKEYGVGQKEKEVGPTSLRLTLWGLTGRGKRGKMSFHLSFRDIGVSTQPLNEYLLYCTPFSKLLSLNEVNM